MGDVFGYRSLATWSLELPELDRGRLPIGPSGLRAIEAAAPLTSRDTRDCRNRDNQIVDTSRESLFALRSILHQVSDYEAILLYLQPPHWHLPGDLSLPTIAEFAHCLHKNLEIEQLRQSQGIEDVVTITQKLCFLNEEYIEHVFTTLGPLHTATEWTLDILAKWFWSIEKCQQLLSVWAIELTGELRRLPIACQHGTLALGYCVKPTVNQTNCFRLGPNASTFSLLSVMTRLRKIIRMNCRFLLLVFAINCWINQQMH